MFKIIAVSNWELYRKFHENESIEEYVEYLAETAGFTREKNGGCRQEKDCWNPVSGLQGQERPDMRPDILIVREKEMGEETYLQFFTSLWERTRNDCREQKGGARIIPHTYLSAARRTGSPCIHLPLPLLRTYQKERALAGIEQMGVSVHSLEEAKEAEQLGAAYLTAGHIFATDCKKGLPPRGLEFLEEICDNVKIPVYAIGGIHPDHLAQIRQTKAAGACMMSEYMKG